MEAYKQIVGVHEVVEESPAHSHSDLDANNYDDTRLKIYMVTIHAVVFWVMTSCRHPEDGGILPCSYAVS